MISFKQYINETKNVSDKETILSNMKEGEWYCIYDFERLTDIKPKISSLNSLVKQGILKKKTKVQPGFHPHTGHFYMKVGKS